MLRLLSLIAATLVCLSSAHAQRDLRALHLRAVRATVQLSTLSGQLVGTGWLLEQRGRPVIITNQHVAPRTGVRMKVGYYRGTYDPPIEGTARIHYSSSAIDLAFLIPDEDPPDTAIALTLEQGDVIRGERVVLGGNPATMPFQTAEGVVTGHTPYVRLPRGRCGEGRNCIVVDCAGFVGTSGGPALNARGNVIGMAWAIPALNQGPAWLINPTFTFLVHVRTIEDELRSVAQRRRR